MRPDQLLLRDAADINRLCLQLLTRWRLPHIQISPDRFPLITAQRAQDRYTRLSQSCNCLLGETLGGLTLLCGMFAVWVFGWSWRDLGPVLLAALVTALVGKAIELAWTRLRLLLLLRRLRRRLDASRDLDAARSDRRAQIETARYSHPGASTRVTRNIPVARARVPRKPRPLVLLRSAADIKRLCLRVATRWTVPRIEIHIDGLPELTVQRAQHRYVRLANGATFLLAGVLATLTLLGGLLYLLASEVPDQSLMDTPELWISKRHWRYVQPVVVATLCAGMLGAVTELALIRLRLLWVLRGLRRQIGA